MSTENDVARSLRSWLRESRHEDADRVLDAVFDQVPATPQRSASWLARRFPIMSNTMRIAIAAAVVVVVAFIGYQVISGPSVGDPSPSPLASAAPSAAQTAAPSELPFGAGGPLSPGTYSLYEGFPVAITFEIPSGWVSCSSGLVEQGACKESTDTEPGSGVAFLIVDNVVADPCTTTELDPPVGPSVEDLVAAISNLEGFEATPATDLTVDGFSGKQFTVTAPLDAGCRLSSWTTASGTNGVGPGESNLLHILDVDGVRVVISGAYQPETSEEQLAAIQQVIASVHIDP
jgi:hypothetical protein